MDKIWVVYDTEKGWSQPGGCGFIYRNFVGAKATREEASKAMWRKMNFLGGEWECTLNGERSEMWERDEDRMVLMEYDLAGPTMFDMNH